VANQQKNQSWTSMLGLDAFALFKNKRMAIFFIFSMMLGAELHAMVADMREKCGPDFWLMLDCWMSQDVNYATKLAHACAPFNLK
ncbi:hypothetical protein ONJ16_25510, partial [Salmonella enterica subsp. enterica serovar Montevideo]|nr:hypothetical protein [Salmonella enterica subsp. enterica serovar Montevideo]